MKKFVIVMLVLGIASFASAGLTWTDGGGVDISTITLTSESDTAVVYISSDSTLAGWFSATIADTSVAEFTAATGTANLGGEGSASLYFHPGMGQYNVYGRAYDVEAPSTIGPGLWVEVTIHATNGDLGTTTAETIGVGSLHFLPSDTLIINHIPEPATIALLGLGGLLLRRRK